MTSSTPILELSGIEKSFFGVKVLKGISASIPTGATLGLVGENGAGKSTLMNILGGNVQPEAGLMRFGGKPYAPRRPDEAAREGIAFIHQELNLFTNLTIAENIFLTAFPRVACGIPLINRRTMLDKTAELLGRVGLKVPPSTLVERLSAGERQLVEIAKALSVETRLLILDEPTTSLTAHESEHLFGILEQLRQRGVSMIYISHNLGEVLRLCDPILVLRDGELIANRPRAAMTEDQVISLMVGRSMTQMFPARTGSPRAETVLEVRGVGQPGVVSNVSFKLHAGEVLGLAGLMGAGRSELARILFGLDPVSRGEILIEGQRVVPSPRRSIQRKMAFLTESRREEGLCLEAAIADNLALVTLPAHASRGVGWLKQSALVEAAAHIRQAVRLTPTARNEQPVKTLSGGNQQKVVLGKWLLARPKVFILDEPTRGIDVGAKYEIYQLIDELAAQGAGVLWISSDLEELIGLCDRILVMNRGQIRDELPRSEFDRERMMRAALQTL